MNGLLAELGGWISFESWKIGSAAFEKSPLQNNTLSLQWILAWLLSPLAWLMGIPVSEVGLAASLLGEKTILNEFVAYVNLSEVMSHLSDRTVVILSYALCGFANFSSIGIQIGGLSALAPERRKDLAQLGVRALIAGSLAAFSTATIAGLLT